jgi:hypothetical protein
MLSVFSFIPTPSVTPTRTLTPTPTVTPTQITELLIIESCCYPGTYFEIPYFPNTPPPSTTVGQIWYISGQSGLLNGCYTIVLTGERNTLLPTWGGSMVGLAGGEDPYSICEQCIDDEHSCPVVSSTPVPTLTPTPTITPTRTPTPTPTCTGSGNFLAGSTCYSFKWNVILRPSRVSACNAAQGADGEVARATNQWKSCCVYQIKFVEGNPSGCLVYDENNDLAGNGWISDGCLAWQVTNGVVTSTAAQICSGASICCGTSPT